MKIEKHSSSLPPDADTKSVSYYNRFTQTYLDNNQNPSDFIDQFLGLLRQGNDKNADRKMILDLGCGPGVNAKYMDSKNFQVIGIDLSKKMIG